MASNQSDISLTALELRRKRLKYQAQHRGVLELDLILKQFARTKLDSMDAVGLEQFERLLSLEEPVLLELMLSDDDTYPALKTKFPDLVILVRAIKSE